MYDVCVCVINSICYTLSVPGTGISLKSHSPEGPCTTCLSVQLAGHGQMCSSNQTTYVHTTFGSICMYTIIITNFSDTSKFTEYQNKVVFIIPARS